MSQLPQFPLQYDRHICSAIRYEKAYKATSILETQFLATANGWPSTKANGWPSTNSISYQEPRVIYGLWHS